MFDATSRRATVASALVAAISAVSSADVVITNLAEPFRATTEIGNNPNPASPPSGAPEWSWAAQSFSTDAASYNLTQIDIMGGDAAAGPTIVAELHEDNAGTIGALITTLSTTDFLATAPSPQTLTPDIPVVLAASTTYWVVLGSQAPGDGTLGWSYANTNNSVGTGVIGAYADSQDSGANWNYGTDFPYFIQVVAEPTATCNTCLGDSNGDGQINFDDITQTLASWGGSCAAK